MSGVKEKVISHGRSAFSISKTRLPCYCRRTISARSKHMLPYRECSMRISNRCLRRRHLYFSGQRIHVDRNRVICNSARMRKSLRSFTGHCQASNLPFWRPRSAPCSPATVQGMPGTQREIICSACGTSRSQAQSAVIAVATTNKVSQQPVGHI